MILSSELIATATASFLLGWTLRKGHFIYLLKNRLTQNQPAKVKLAIIVRSDLKMSTGKIASQCSHATLACYRHALSVRPDIVKHWECLGEPKVVLKSNTGEEGLRELGKKAANAGLVAAMIRDAGRTQVPKGSPTVLGIGPDCDSKIDEITSGLKLL